MKLLDNLAERFGLNAYATGDYVRAEKWFRRLERSEPDSPRVLRNLGVVLLAQGDAAGAAEYLGREERLYGESCQRHRSLADIAYASGSASEAARRYAAALDYPEAGTEPDTSFLKTRIAICRDPKRFEESREAASLFIEGERARREGNPEEAYGAFEAAAKLDPTHWPALNNAGTIALMDRHDPASALLLFEKAAALVRNPILEANTAAAKSEIGKKVAPNPG